jgi:hypothetical protein
MTQGERQVEDGLRAQLRNNRNNFWPLVNAERGVAATHVHPKTGTVFLFSQEYGLRTEQAVQEVTVEWAARHLVDSRLGQNGAQFRYATEEEINAWFADQQKRIEETTGAQRAGQNRSISVSPAAVIQELQKSV